MDAMTTTAPLRQRLAAWLLGYLADVLAQPRYAEHPLTRATQALARGDDLSLTASERDECRGAFVSDGAERAMSRLVAHWNPDQPARMVGWVVGNIGRAQHGQVVANHWTFKSGHAGPTQAETGAHAAVEDRLMASLEPFGLRPLWDQYAARQNALRASGAAGGLR